MITTKEIEHLAKLSRIALNPEEIESLQKEFDSILQYVDQLKKVDVSLDGGARVGSLKNITRSDEVKSSNKETLDSLLKEAPLREGDYISVKKIIAQD